MATASDKKDVLCLEGSNYLRQRLLLATLSGKPIRIKEMRAKHDDPGLWESEVNLIRLLDKVTNGSRIEINETGTSLYYQPGLLHGGTLQHECSTLRGIGYYLEVLICLAPFCKNPMNITLTGVTNNVHDVSVDAMIYGAIPLLQKVLVIDDGLELKINKRGMAPEGGGEVVFKCPVRKSLKPIQMMEQGKVKRIRGIVYTARVSPAISNRLVEAAKGVFLEYIPDVYIHTDHCQGPRSGKSPGYGITVVAETTTGVFFVAEAVSEEQGILLFPRTPEEVGQQAAHFLLEEIYRGGCVSASFQTILLLFMTMAPKDISKCLTGPLSPYAIEFLRNIEDVLGVTFKLETQQVDVENYLKTGAHKVVLTCLGSGYQNLNKRVL